MKLARQRLAHALGNPAQRVKDKMVDKDTILQRLPELTLKLYSDKRVKITSGGEIYIVDFWGLKILDAFSKPRPMGEVLSELARDVRSAQDWIDLTSQVMGLVKAGILVEPDARQVPQLRAGLFGFDAAYIHIQMLNDRRRTGAYLQALQESVKPGDVVLDLGTGSGILGVAAAQAGAGTVYAIEASGIAEVAGQVFKANGCDKKIHLLQGWSTQVDLPERVDLLVSELIGNDPLHERVLEMMIDGRKRFLKAGGKLIPARIRVYALPVSLPEEIYQQYIFTKPMLEEWGEWYQIDFSPLLDARAAGSLGVGFDPRQARTWGALSDEVLLTSIDFSTLETSYVDIRKEICLTNTGLLNAVLVYFELDLAEGVQLSTRPSDVLDDNHWSIMAWLLNDTLHVREKERVILQYAYQAQATSNGVKVTRRVDDL